MCDRGAVSTTPPPPLDPNDPRAGDPTRFSTWIGIGGVIIVIIVIGTINRWNRGPEGNPTPTTASSPSVSQSAASTSTSPDTTSEYKILFDGRGTARYEVPNRGQTFRSAEATATWHLEYTYASYHNLLPDPSTATVTGSGSSQNQPGTEKDCTSGNPQYTPSFSVLKRPGLGETFTIGSPFFSDLNDAKGACLSFSKAYYASCGPDTPNCPNLSEYWTATFTIKPGQTGTVVTRIAPKPLDFTNTQPVLGGDHSTASWDGTITVIRLN
jgi:hypothetical protein